MQLFSTKADTRRYHEMQSDDSDDEEIAAIIANTNGSRPPSISKLDEKGHDSGGSKNDKENFENGDDVDDGLIVLETPFGGAVGQLPHESFDGDDTLDESYLSSSDDSSTEGGMQLHLHTSDNDSEGHDELNLLGLASASTDLARMVELDSHDGQDSTAPPLLFSDGHDDEHDYYDKSNSLDDMTESDIHEVLSSLKTIDLNDSATESPVTIGTAATTATASSSFIECAIPKDKTHTDSFENIPDGDEVSESLAAADDDDATVLFSNRGPPRARESASSVANAPPAANDIEKGHQELEEDKHMQSNYEPRRSRLCFFVIFLAAVIVLAMIGVAIYAGVALRTNKSASSSSKAPTPFTDLPIFFPTVAPTAASAPTMAPTTLTAQPSTETSSPSLAAPTLLPTSIPTTEPIANTIAPTLTVTTQPARTRLPSASPSAECKDSDFVFDIDGTKRNCRWLANQSIAFQLIYCQPAYGLVREFCPATCNYCANRSQRNYQRMRDSAQ
ncbi:hypothetical protein MPSEU_000320200 [Mayamaea pseudoterrestris]|nr:hypothetical protein MPSEU_000320200 [Mayamaea pseudoterrestris]